MTDVSIRNMIGGTALGIGAVGGAGFALAEKTMFLTDKEFDLNEYQK